VTEAVRGDERGDHGKGKKSLRSWTSKKYGGFRIFDTNNEEGIAGAEEGEGGQGKSSRKSKKKMR